MTQKISFTPEQVERAKQMRVAGATWTAVADALGVSQEGVRRHLDPGYRERRNAYIAAKQREYSPPTGRRRGTRGYFRDYSRHAGLTPVESEALYDPRRDGDLGALDLTGILMGDPPPNRIRF